MPADYKKPPYKSNVDKYKSNAEKYRDAERNAPPPDRYGQRVGDSDHVKLPANEPKPKPK